MPGLYHIPAWRSTRNMEDRVIKIVIVLSLASVLVCAALVAAPVVFGVVAGGGVSVLMLVSIYQIVRSDRLSVRRPQRDNRASATIDNVPVKKVTVLQ